MRYSNRLIRINNSALYRKQFLNRGISFVNQYGTPRMNYPTPAEIDLIDTVAHAWQLGDRYYKLAHTYYDDPRLWWVIAWFNLLPTESHVELGDVILIPKDLEEILSIYDI
jgi:nucleoid-associated protein YgaU